MVIMGIDPGITGGIVILNENREVLAKYVMPAIITKKQTKSRDTKKIRTKTTTQLDLGGLRKIFDEWDDFVDCIFLEKVASRPGQGVSSVFKFGRVFGILEGMIAMSSLPVVMVTPREWTKEVHKGVSSSMEPKDRSKVVLGRLFPKIDLRASQRAKKPHEGMLDALLIAEYGLRVHN